MKVYQGARYGIGSVSVTVHEERPTKPDGPRKALTHLVRHSPTGFEWGYGGSGPSDLARSLLADLFGEPDVHQEIYQAFKVRVIAGLGDDWILTEPYAYMVVRTLCIEKGFHADACVRCLDRGLVTEGYCGCRDGVKLKRAHGVAGGIDDHVLGETRN